MTDELFKMDEAEILKTLLDRFDADSIELSSGEAPLVMARRALVAGAETPRYHWSVLGTSRYMLDTQRALTAELAKPGGLDNAQALCDWLSLWTWAIREYAAVTRLDNDKETDR